MSFLRGAVFLKSVASLGQEPASAGEIAFVGRSNAGKSSAINALSGRRLAMVSKTPGRTRLINYYALGAQRFIVDLPGYGYARVSGATQAPWLQLVGGYLQTRSPLCGLVVVMDVRHPVTDLDRRMLEWFRPTGKPVHVLLTKSDKLSREAARRILLRVESEIAALVPGASAQLFSSLRRTGLEETASVIRTWLYQGSGDAGDPRQMKTPGTTGGLEIKTPGPKGEISPGQNALRFKAPRSGRRSGRRPKPSTV